MSLLACALIVVAVSCLALSTPKHFSDVFARMPNARVRIALRAVGGAMLAAALVPCIAVWGTAIGIVAWFGLLAAAVLIVVAVITYGPIMAFPKSVESERES